MNLSDQLCTPSQAKRLWDLGIEYDKAIFWLDREDPERIFIRDIERGLVGGIPLYSVAELGLILPAEIRVCKLCQWPIPNGKGKTISYGMQYRKICNQAMGLTVPEQTIFRNTEAGVRAKLLIHLLEKNIVTPEEINERIK